ncbi:MAG: ParB/RepB/Spo0J family partition protein [Pirellulales bacterium]
MSNENVGQLKQTINLVSTDGDHIRPHPDNARRGNVDAIRQSIQANGFFGALVVQRSTGHILVGNHRFRAAQAEEMLEVPVIFVDCDDDEAKRILLADNRTSDLGVYDDELLLELLTDVQALDQLDGTGWGDDDIAEMLAGLNNLPDLDTNPQDLQVEYQIVVLCDNDEHQRQTLQFLADNGLNVKASLL